MTRTDEGVALSPHSQAVQRRRRRDMRLTLALTLPGLALVAVFITYPVVETVRLSFQSAGSFGNATFIGWSNFQNLTSDADFLRAIQNNLLFTVIVTVGTVGLGTLFALIINQRVRFWRIYSFLFFLPVIIPMTVIAILWANSLNPQYGWLTAMIHWVFPSFAPNGLLTDPSLAIYVICAVAIWQVSGFPMVIVLGGLRAIAPEIVDSARLDGASATQIAWYVSLPMTKDVIATVTLLQIIFSFKIFDLIQAMTKGGPGAATQVFGTLIYRDAFANGYFGYASAIAVVSTIAIVGISLVYLALIKPKQIERA